MQETPLRKEHENLGARMVEFAGWYMPVQYSGIRDEHLHVRSHVGIFDVSHMGEIRVKGAQSLPTLQWLTSNDVSVLDDGQAQYNLLTNENGGIVDDIIIYCVQKGKDYLICVNAANAEKDWQWMRDHNEGAELVNESDEWGQIAVQGPKAVELTARVLSARVKEIQRFQFISYEFSGVNVYVARTGYTGEDGFEIFVPKDKTVALWRQFFAKGKELDLKPIGLGARDTLRTEMRYSLYGQEIDDLSNPYEAGLGWVVKPDSKNFVGKEQILAVKKAGLKRKLVGFKMVDKGIPRHDYKVLSIDKKVIGKVTSGTVSPCLNESIGIAYVSTEFAKPGQRMVIDIRGRPAEAEIVGGKNFLNKD